MSATHIKESVESVIEYYTKNPDEARGPGAPITAVMDEGLRCRVLKQDGTEIVTTDMSTGIGGGGSAPSPGLIFRAALASCDATFIALRAAQVGIKITTLEVTVEGDPDDMGTLGFLGIDDSISAGESSLRLNFRIGAENASPERLRELVKWITAHSPVGESVSRAIPIKVDVKIV
ncbi:MAG: OsmC family protein [Anaerolineales bacterium]|nr:OsmC family protein [Chloroflexota bacterium]MBL6982173.1 OsmC family protein [Anaerolineales bacterium]